MKKIVCNVLSLIFFICTIISLIVVVTVRGVGFIDLSSVARMIFGVTALFFVSMSLLLWQTEYKKRKKVKLIAWFCSLCIISFGVFGYNIYKPLVVKDAVLEQVKLDAVVVEKQDTYILVKPTKLFQEEPNVRVKLWMENIPAQESINIGDALEITFSGEIKRNSEEADVITLIDVYEIRQ